MSDSPELSDIILDFASSAEFDSGRSGDFAVADIGPMCDEACLNFRMLAGCELLLNADSDAFYLALARSGAVRLAFLERCRREAPELRTPYRGAGNSAGLLDALAARHFELARQVVRNQPAEWYEGEEYSEDFLFVRLLSLLVEPGAEPDREEVVLAISALADALEGAEPGRLGVLNAISERNREDFQESFMTFLEEREEALAEQPPAVSPHVEVMQHIDRQIYVDALALLNIAELHGLQVEREYPMCPPGARVRMAGELPSLREI